MSLARRMHVGLPHAARVAMHEALLRGAARNYAEACGDTDEEPSAAELGRAAVDYAVTLLQGAGAARAAERPAAKRSRRAGETEGEAP